MQKMRKPVGLLGVVASMFVVALASAEEIRFGEEKFTIDAGVFLQNFDTNIQVKGSGGSGAEVGLEDVLGYDDDDTTTTFRASWRLFDRHRVELSYFNANRDVVAVATEDIDIGDGEIIPIGASYKSTLDMQIMPIKYSYSFIKNERSELYGSLGLHWYSVDYEVFGGAGISEEVWEGEIDAKADAPLPLIGGGYDYYITDRWKAGIGAQAFYIKIDDENFAFEGSLFNLNLATEYYLFNNVGIGVALSYFKLDVDVDDSDWRGKLEYEYWGPSAYLKVRF